MPRFSARCERDAWRPLLAWGDDDYLQWGRSGLVMSGNDKCYTTAFFEAFPSGGGFYRGEGKDLEAAEAAAHAKVEKVKACRAHVWGRRSYTNGLGICTGCGANKSDAFQSIPELGGWKKPLGTTELSCIQMGTLYPDGHGMTSDTRMWKRRIFLKAKLAGIVLPPTDMPEEDYVDACEEAVLQWYVERVKAGGAPKSNGKGIAKLFDGVTLAGLKAAAIDRGLLPA